MLCGIVLCGNSFLDMPCYDDCMKKDDIPWQNVNAVLIEKKISFH